MLLFANVTADLYTSDVLIGNGVSATLVLMCRKMVVTSAPCVTAATGAGMTAAGKYIPAQLIQRWSFQRSHRDQSGLLRGWASEDRTNPVLHVVSMGRGSEGVVDRAVGTSGSVRKHTNQGTVPLHGRLFAQWVHHASPRECPLPSHCGKRSTSDASSMVAAGGTPSCGSVETLACGCAGGGPARGTWLW